MNSFCTAQSKLKSVCLLTLHNPERQSSWKGPREAVQLLHMYVLKDKQDSVELI